MQELVPTLFHLAFLAQVLLVSFYLPWRLMRRVDHLVETYPPSSHPRLYPGSLDDVRTAQRSYRNANLVVLGVGLGLLGVSIYQPGEEMLWDTISVLGIYTLLQYSPLLLTVSSDLPHLDLGKKPDLPATRRATLQRRRLFDFVSPALVGLAVLLYVGFVGLVVYVQQFEFPWFGGYWNVVGITALDLLCAGAIVHSLYGRKKDPHQAHEDRLRQIGLNVKAAVFSSIVGTVFVAITIVLGAVGLRDWVPVAMTLYLQIVAAISFRTVRMGHANFDVYREEPLGA